jgi:two-component system chemotaxis sensor kinase CheA
MAQDPYRYFRIEARELLEQLGKGALDLEKGSSTAAAVSGLLRAAHTLKGAARVVKQAAIADETHAIEEALTPYRDTEGEVAREAIEGVLKLLDSIRQRIDSISAPAAADTAPAPATARAVDHTVAQESLGLLRADVGEMNTLLDGISEAHSNIATLRRTLPLVERAERLINVLAADPRARMRTAADTVAVRSPERGSESKRWIFEELRAVMAGLERSVSGTADRMDRELQQVRDLAERLRLTPCDVLSGALERTARDAAAATGKQVRFDARGGELRLDAHVLHTIQGALHQCVRNAVAHGIEPAHERRQRGKSDTGSICIEFAATGRSIVVTCRDDGRGVDFDAVRRSLRKRGEVAAVSESTDRDALLDALLRGGISTSGNVTEISGRGIGLDLVRETGARLGGSARILTDEDRGTTIELVFPASLMSMEALTVHCGGVRATLPLRSVRSTLRIAPKDVVPTAQGETIAYEGQMVPLAALGRMIGQKAESVREVRARTAVLLSTGSSLAAIAVDGLVGTSSIVLRPVPDLAPPTPMVAGLSMDAEGNPQIMLDPEVLIREARQIGAPTQFKGVVHAPILIVDDSLTTRMLEQRILESAGFEVETAVSGEDGLQAAARNRYALFLVDVDMPGIDGFTFVERCRADPALRDIPAILVTSRASPEDRQRGKDAGAQAYIVKGDFDQAELLARINELVRRT